MAQLGTSVWKWGICYEKIEVVTRKATVTTIKSGPSGVDGASVSVPLDVEPELKTETKVVPRPFFEYRPISRVLVDPHLLVGDIREADFVVDVRYMDYYQLKDLKENNSDEKGKTLEGWSFPASLIDLWLPPEDNIAPKLGTDQQAYITGAVHHAEDPNIKVNSDPFLKKMEILEYWDKQRKILVLDRKKVIYTGPNKFKQIPFLSANWWNRPKAFYGMGLGLIVGQNQRVDQGTINAILKVLSFGVNPIYLRNRGANSPTQMIRTGLGKILNRRRQC